MKTESIMKMYKYITRLLLAIVVAACSEDSDICPGVDKMGEIKCSTECQDASMSRAYFEMENTISGSFYRAKWDKEDMIAICFDDSGNAHRFNLLKGDNTENAIFYGPLPDNYSKISAVYPYDIFKARTSGSIEVRLPSEIDYDAQKILCGAMPMFAQSTAGALNFYNLMGVMKISVKGTGLLRSISISSPDKQGMSGNARINLDGNNIPELLMEESGTGLTVNTGALLLDNNSRDIYIPVPATTYNNGLKLEFCFEGRSETRILEGALHFERAVLRPVKTYEMSVPFEFENYEPKDNEIWYKSNDQPQISAKIDLGTPIISNSFSKNNHIGVIATKSGIEKIGGPIFQTPESITFVKLPDCVREIAMDGLKGTSIEEFKAPDNLRLLGTDAFLRCSNLRRVILNDGLESMGLEVFGECPKLEYVYIPESVQIIGAYSFRQSTNNLDHWDGDCQLIGEDRHTLYSNSAYGMISEKPTQIDAIAGCNLTEYKIPDQALFTQNYAFSGCKKLKKLIIHEDFRLFGLYVFSSLTSLETIECHATTPPGFNSDENFSSKTLKIIKVPHNCIDVYMQADGWKHFADKIVAL